MTVDSPGPGDPLNSGEPPRAKRRRPAVLRWLTAAEAAVGGLLLALILVLMLLQAAQRYLPGGGWVWTGELAQFALVWLTFAMSGHLTARDGHVTLKLVDVVAGRRTLRLVGVFANIVVAVVCLNLVYEAFVLVTDDTQQTSAAMGMPLGWLYVIPLAGLLLTTLRAVVAVFLPGPETETETDDEHTEQDTRSRHDGRTPHGPAAGTGREEPAG